MAVTGAPLPHTPGMRPGDASLFFTMSRERPILFSGPMVRAIFEGKKTQTRRALSPQPTRVLAHDSMVMAPNIVVHYPDGWRWRNTYSADESDLGFGQHLVLGGHCRYGNPGDRLWVKETFARVSDGSKSGICFRADGEEQIDREAGERWSSPYHMSRALSRLTLEITGVRVERLQDISEADAKAEGVMTLDNIHPIARATSVFEELWDSINGKRDGCAWDDNPWVWVVEFKKA